MACNDIKFSRSKCFTFRQGMLQSIVWNQRGNCSNLFGFESWMNLDYKNIVFLLSLYYYTATETFLTKKNAVFDIHVFLSSILPNRTIETFKNIMWMTNHIQ